MPSLKLAKPRGFARVVGAPLGTTTALLRLHLGAFSRAKNLDNDGLLSGNHYFLSILRVDSGLT